MYELLGGINELLVGVYEDSVGAYKELVDLYEELGRSKKDFLGVNEELVVPNEVF